MYTQGYNDGMSQLGLDKTAGIGSAIRAGAAAVKNKAGAVGRRALDLPPPVVAAGTVAGVGGTALLGSHLLGSKGDKAEEAIRPESS